MFLLVPVYPGCPGQTAVKWLLLLLLQNFLIAPRNLLAMTALQSEIIDCFQKKELYHHHYAKEITTTTTTRPPQLRCPSLRRNTPFLTDTLDIFSHP